MNEIIFVSRGEVDVGYTLNKQITYALRFVDKIMVAAYNATYNFRTIATYKCHTDIFGYTIKQHIWKDILDGKEPGELSTVEKEITGYIKEEIRMYYYSEIFRKIEHARNKGFRNIRERADY